MTEDEFDTATADMQYENSGIPYCRDLRKTRRDLVQWCFSLTILGTSFVLWAPAWLCCISAPAMRARLTAGRRPCHNDCDCRRGLALSHILFSIQGSMYRHHNSYRSLRRVCDRRNHFIPQFRIHRIRQDLPVALAQHDFSRIPRRPESCGYHHCMRLDIPRDRLARRRPHGLGSARRLFDNPCLGNGNCSSSSDYVGHRGRGSG